MVKFGEEICKELCDLHEEGLPQTTCADFVGVNRKTIRRWLDKGEAAKSGKYRQFYLNWRKAEAKYERHHLNHIDKNKSWMAHQYLLQVKDPQRYVVAEKQEIENKIEAEVKAEAQIDNKTIFDLVDEELELTDD